MCGADNTMHTCCVEPNRNVTLTDEELLLPSETGNFTITYDVTQAYPGSYVAKVGVVVVGEITVILSSWNRFGV